MDKKVLTSLKRVNPSPPSPQDLRCIWVSAGLLSYKLCKYNFECDRCPLDWELRNLSLAPGAEGSALGSSSVSKSLIRQEPSLFEIKESLFYHPGHTWLKVERADQVRVGLDPFLGRLLEGVRVVVLPLSGSRGVRGENLCSLIFEEGIVQTVFPISGLILFVNPKLKDNPELVFRDPLGEGFLLSLRPKNLQRDQRRLLPGEEALGWYQREWERFKETLTSEVRQEQQRLGVTMQDGEMSLSEIKRLIGLGRFIHLVNVFLRQGEQPSAPTKPKPTLLLQPH